MPRYDFSSTRLFVDLPIRAGALLRLEKKQAHYLVNVLRHAGGQEVLIFNGRDGEWRAQLQIDGRRAALLPTAETRPQPPASQLTYLFAPLKKARLDYMVQKAVEMGAGVLQPVLTEFTQVARVNTARMRANIIEAAQQCGVLAVPECREPARLEDLLADWPGDSRLIYCDETDEGRDPLTILQGLSATRLAVLIGPEGGFSGRERSLLKSLAFVSAIPLGPRILRADTAAVAALAVVQAAIGDWR